MAKFTLPSLVAAALLVAASAGGMRRKQMLGRSGPQQQTRAQTRASGNMQHKELSKSSNTRNIPRGSDLPPQMGDPLLSTRVAGARPEQITNRPELINYNPVANPAAVVTSPDNMARFTVLTDRLIRMEYAKTPGVFEDHSTIAIMNRALTPPQFSSSVTDGILTIKTSQVMLSYTVGQKFSSSSLSVTSVNSASAFTSWNYGDPFPGNLLGTIRGLDGQNNTPLNCTQNEYIGDNVSRNVTGCLLRLISLYLRLFAG